MLLKVHYVVLATLVVHQTYKMCDIVNTWCQHTPASLTVATCRPGPSVPKMLPNIPFRIS